MLRFESRGGGGLRLVLLPGAACGPDVWEPLAEALAPAGYALEIGVVAGFGAEPPAPETSWSALRASLLAHLSDGPPAILVGHSLGGALALDAARDAAVPGVVLIESGPRLGPLVYRTDSLALQRQRAADMIASAEDGDAFLALLVASMSPMFVSERAFERVAREAGLSEPRVVAELLAALVELDFEPPAIPTLHLVGGAGAPAQIDAFGAQVDRAEVFRVPGARHFPMVEAPDATAAAIRDWIGRRLSTAADRGL